MLLFAKEKLALLAVPKTGTSAWHAALGPTADLAFRSPPPLKHMPLRRFQRTVGPMLKRAGIEEIETVAVIREPESWLGSWYRYRQRLGLEGQPESTRGVSFDAFVRAYLSDDRPAYANLGSQARFVTPRHGGRRIDRLFRYEDQGAFLSFLEARLGRAVQLPRRNVSPEMELKLSAETRALLHAARAEDFALYQGLFAA